MKNRITVIDVAKKAGVSQSTVSRVLNDHPQIRESTRKKVLQAIEELGFSPNQVARSMVVKKTGTLGLIVGDISNPFYAETAKVIIGKARQINYDVIIIDTDYNYDHFEKHIKTLVGKRVDGILVGTIHHKDSMVNELFESGFPILYFNRKPDRKDLHYITVDNEKGVSLAVRHLVELGHEKIGFLTSLSRYPTFYERYLGYMAALQKFGIRIDQSLVYSGEISHKLIFEYVSNILDKPDRPTSFLATTDQQAVSVIDSVIRLGFRVPEDISVVGFDDIDIASHPYIGLTTVSSQKKLMAELALEKLIELIEGKQQSPGSIQVVVEPKLIIRRTTGVAGKNNKGGDS